MKTGLPLFDAQVNASVLDEDVLRLSGQNLKLYTALLSGAKTNRELMDITRAMNLTARISDVRIELQDHGWDVVKMDSKDLPAGLNRYCIKDGKGKLII